jgi:hypothetical protein
MGQRNTFVQALFLEIAQVCGNVLKIKKFPDKNFVYSAFTMAAILIQNI